MMRATTAVSILFLSSLSVGIPAAGAQENVAVFRLEVRRDPGMPDCTPGRLVVNGTTVARGLELPLLDGNGKKGKSAAPIGVYIGTLRYDGEDHWTVVPDDPGQAGTELHIGRRQADTDSCIALGDEVEGQQCAVAHTTRAYGRLKEALYGAAVPSQGQTMRVELKIQ